MSKTRIKISLRSTLKEIRPVNILMLFIEGFINSFGVTMFLFPVKLYDSGISGLSMLLDQLTPDYLTPSLFLSGTIVKAIGGYSKEDKEIIYFIVNRFQINKLKNIVHDIDKSAFISLQDVADIIKNHE